MKCISKVKHILVELLLKFWPFIFEINFSGISLLWVKFFTFMEDLQMAKKDNGKKNGKRQMALLTLVK